MVNKNTAASGGISTCPLCHALFLYSIYYDAATLSTAMSVTCGGKCTSRPNTVPNTLKTSTISTYHKQNSVPSKAPLNSNTAILLYYVIHHYLNPIYSNTIPSKAKYPFHNYTWSSHSVI